MAEALRGYLPQVTWIVLEGYSKIGQYIPADAVLIPIGSSALYGGRNGWPPADALLPPEAEKMRAGVDITLDASIPFVSLRHQRGPPAPLHF
jgi:hypothetical protein